MNATQQLHDLGQSLWLDNITREGVDDEALAGELQREDTKGFAKSWSDLIYRIASKSAALTKANRS